MASQPFFHATYRIDDRWRSHEYNDSAVMAVGGSNRDTATPTDRQRVSCSIAYNSSVAAAASSGLAWELS